MIGPKLYSILIFCLSILLLATNMLPMSVISVLTILLYVIFDCLDAGTALAGFADPTVMIYASMFVLAAGFSRTRFMRVLSSRIVRLSGGSMRRAWVAYLFLAALLTSMVSSPISIFIVIAPLCVRTCREFGESPSRYLFGLAAVSIGFCCTLPFGSAISQSILCTGFFEAYGLGRYTMSMTDPLKGRWPFMIVLMLWAIFLAPGKSGEKSPLSEPESDVIQEEPPSLSRFAETAGPVLFFLTILMMVIGPRIGIAAWISCMTGAVLMVICRVLTEQEAIAALPFHIIFIYAGAVATGNALIGTGAGDVIGGLLAALIGNTKNGYLIGAIAYLSTWLLTQFMLNSGVTALIRPILLLMCASLGADPVGPMLLMLSASVSSFLSPMASPVIPACMSLGGYSKRDLFRRGWGISLVIAAVQIVWVMSVFPAFPTA